MTGMDMEVVYIGSMNAMNIICNMVTELSNDIGTDNEKLVFNVIDNSPLKRVKVICFILRFIMVVSQMYIINCYKKILY